MLLTDWNQSVGTSVLNTNQKTVLCVPLYSAKNPHSVLPPANMILSLPELSFVDLNYLFWSTYLSIFLDQNLRANFPTQVVPVNQTFPSSNSQFTSDHILSIFVNPIIGKVNRMAMIKTKYSFTPLSIPKGREGHTQRPRKTKTVNRMYSPFPNR